MLNYGAEAPRLIPARAKNIMLRVLRTWAMHFTLISVAYPGWHTPGVQTEDGVLAPPGKLKNGAPRRRCWMGEGGSMLEVIISFSDNVIGIRSLKIALTLN